MRLWLTLHAPTLPRQNTRETLRSARNYALFAELRPAKRQSQCRDNAHNTNMNTIDTLLTEMRPIATPSNWSPEADRDYFTDRVMLDDPNDANVNTAAEKAADGHEQLAEALRQLLGRLLPRDPARRTLAARLPLVERLSVIKLLVAARQADDSEALRRALLTADFAAREHDRVVNRGLTADKSFSLFELIEIHDWCVTASMKLNEAMDKLPAPTRRSRVLTTAAAN